MESIYADIRAEPGDRVGQCESRHASRHAQADDWHLHLRDGEMLIAVVNETARQFARAIVMPNLDPPVMTVEAAHAYRSRIIAAVMPGLTFTPLMTVYLTDNIDPSEIERGFGSGVLTAAKLYPAHATTNSARGVTDPRLFPVSTPETN